jgi:purine-binding chemotaxis protein CheW
MSRTLPGNTAAALRDAFDRSFAQAHGAQREAYENMLAIRVAGHPYAVRLAEIASLQTDRRIVPLPSRTPHLLGLVGLRGAMVPIYDLCGLMGYAAAPDPRWLLLVRAPEPVGLGFELFEAHLRINAGQHATTQADVLPAQHVTGLIRTADVARPLIHIASLLREIAAGADRS